MAGKSPKSATWMKATAFFVIIACIAFIANQAGYFGQNAVSVNVNQQATAAGGVGRSCQGITAITLNAAARNPINTSTQYVAATFRVVGSESDQIIATGTGTSGNTLTYTAINTIPCDAGNFDGTLYATASATLNSAKKVYSIKGTSDSTILLVPQSDQIQLTFLSNLFANTSVKSATTSESAATAMNAGDVRTGTIRVEAPSAGFSQYGSTDGGILVAINTVNAAAFSESAMSLTSGDVALRQVDCDTYKKASNVDSADRCYLLPAYTSSSGTWDIKWTLVADGGTAPGASDDPVVYFEDIQYFDDVDNTIQIGTHTSSGTNVGETQCSATLDNS